MRWKLRDFIIKFILNLSILQNLPHNHPILFQDQNTPFVLQYLLLFYPTSMKMNVKGIGTIGNWSHLIICQEWISSSFHQHLCILNLIVRWCFKKRSSCALKLNEISQLMIKDEIRSIIYERLKMMKWSTITKISYLFIQSHPIIKFSHY